MLGDLERRYTKKDAKPWARFTLMTKEKDFSLPMFTEAYEKFGPKLEERDIMVIEGIASHRGGETRITANSALPVDAALNDLIEEITWLLDPESKDIVSFLEEIFVLSDKGLGKTLIRLGFSKDNEGTGLVAEVDDRFTMRITSETFQRWRAKAPVRAARVKIKPPDPPQERTHSQK